MNQRLLITSSRTWRDALTAEYWLTQAYWQLGGGPVTLVSGNAEGGDKVCEGIWERHLLPVERHIPNWTAPCRERCRAGHRRPYKDGRTYCPAAGMYRNEDMALTGVHLCLELRDLCTRDNCWKTPKPHWSHGAEGCADFAEQLGIETWRVPA